MQPQEDSKALGKTAIKVSKDTTQVLQSALKTAQEGKQVGIDTLVELNRQDERLDDLGRVGKELTDEIEEVKGLTRYLNRCWCCFLCFDPPEKKAKQRMAARKAAAANAKRAGATNGKKNQAKTADERKQLLGEQGQKYQASTTNYAEQLEKEGLGGVGKELDHEHHKQEQVVGQLVSTLDEMSQIAVAQGQVIISSGQKIQDLNTTVNVARHQTHLAHEHLKTVQ